MLSSEMIVDALLAKFDQFVTDGVIVEIGEEGLYDVGQGPAITWELGEEVIERHAMDVNKHQLDISVYLHVLSTSPALDKPMLQLRSAVQGEIDSRVSYDLDFIEAVDLVRQAKPEKSNDGNDYRSKTALDFTYIWFERI